MVDDDESIRRSLARLFRSAGISVLTFESAEEFLNTPAPDCPSCLVLDVRMDRLTGLDLQRQIAGSGAQVVFISGHGDVSMCATAMKAGAVDFLTKPVDGEELLLAVNQAFARSAAIRKAATERASVRGRINTLTAREFEVMRHVIAGALNKQIAEGIGASEKTVKIHRGRVMEKMGVKSVADLVRETQAAGVVPCQLPDQAGGDR